MSKSKETTAMFAKVKEQDSEDGAKVYTFIGASTLPDRTKERLGDGTLIKGEILSKKVLDKFAEKINDSTKFGGEYGSYRTISLFHNRVLENNYQLEEAGYILPGSASVKELENYPGNYGLFVDVEVNKKFTPPENYSDYDSEKIEYKIEKNALGLSIEYLNRPEQERIVDLEGEKYRYILDSDDFRGFGFARPDLIGNPTAIRVKETVLADQVSEEAKSKENIFKMEENKEILEKLAASEAKIKELSTQIDNAKAEGETVKLKELQNTMEQYETKFKELKLENDATAAKLKESIELAFSGLNFSTPAKTKEQGNFAKVKEIYAHAEKRDWISFEEQSNSLIEQNQAKLKELMARDGPGFDFEKYQTLAVKCKGNQMVVVPTAKTKDVISSSTMDETVYTQTNAMFADRYVAGITETFLKEDSLLKAMPKEQHLGGNDKYQWRMWTEYTTVTGTSTLSVNPDVTSVARTDNDFIKLETRICEYRKGVEVTDFVQHHSMAAVGDLLGLQIQRAAEAVTESMNSDLFKGNVETTSGWYGFVGLIAVADSSTYSTIYGKTRSAANRLLDSTLANTFVSTSEAISVSVVRSGYEKVLTHGSNLGDIVIVAHPTQVRRLFNTEDAAIRYGPLTMNAVPANWGFSRSMLPHIDGIPIIRDYRCESTAAGADMFAVVDLSPSKGFNLVVSKPLGVRGLAKVGTSEAAYVSFWGAAVYKSPRNVFVHTSLTAT